MQQYHIQRRQTIQQSGLGWRSHFLTNQVALLSETVIYLSIFDGGELQSLSDEKKREN